MENDQQGLIVKNGLIPVFAIVTIMALAVVGSELKGAYNRAALDFMSSKERTPEEMREEVIKWLCACA